MADIINLRRARKTRDRTEAAAKAEARRRSFGRTKSDREHLEAERELDSRRLDGCLLTGNDATERCGD